MKCTVVIAMNALCRKLLGSICRHGATGDGNWTQSTDPCSAWITAGQSSIVCL